MDASCSVPFLGTKWNLKRYCLILTYLVGSLYWTFPEIVRIPHVYRDIGRISKGSEFFKNRMFNKYSRLLLTRTFENSKILRKIQAFSLHLWFFVGFSFWESKYRQLAKAFVILSILLCPQFTQNKMSKTWFNSTIFKNMHFNLRSPRKIYSIILIINNYKQRLKIRSLLC